MYPIMYPRFYILLLLVTFSLNLHGQALTDYAVQLRADVQNSPAKVTLSWDAIPFSTGYTIYRKTKTATSWGTALATVTTTSYVDNNVVADAAYEYHVMQQGGNNASGYIFVGITAPPIHNRGALLLLVDTAFANSCAAQIDRLMKDISGDGWQVIRKDFASTVTDVTIRNFIITTQQTNTSLNAVYVVGHIAIPYSGEINPDGHGDHIGAWPADVYYADINDTWSDNFINNTSATMPENKNTPGDGKWDQSQIPGDVELQVGRVDFFHMPTFAKTEAAMMQTYLDRAHKYKMDSIAIVKRGLIDNNFSVASYPEAFAANAYRNFPVLVGKDSIKNLDFVGTLNTTSYQWAYGCGGGTHTSAGGIGSTASFKTNNVNAIFTMLFGSYFGDWGAQNNFLRAPLCSDVPALTSCWAGRPNWYFHHMALGENIGYSTRLSQNNIGLYDPTGYGARFIHIALMGDPTLRTDYIKPPGNVVLTSIPKNGANVSWTASADAGVIGYYVYRCDDRFGAYAKRSDLITGTSFIDSGGNDGLKYYMVRAVKLQTTPSGTYYNLSIGEVDSQYVYYPVSVKEQFITENVFNIYPNPVNNVLNIAIKGNLHPGSANIAIIDMAGRTVTPSKVYALDNNGTAKIDLSNLLPGIYHLIATIDNKTFTRQFVRSDR